MIKCIIVDDDYLVRKGIAKTLEKIGNKLSVVGEAENGETAIGLINEFTPEIIIMDMYMPVMDGTALLKYISGNHPNTQIIVISGYRSFDYAVETIQANAISYLVKPFSSEELQTSVLKAIDNIQNAEGKEQNQRNISHARDRISYEFDVQILKSLILGIKIQNLEFNSEAVKIIAENRSLVLFSIFNLSADSAALEAVCSDCFENRSFVVCDHNFNVYTFFVIKFYADQPTDQLIKSDSVHLYSELCRISDGVDMGVSLPEKKVTKLNSAFLQCITALDNKLLFDKGRIISYRPDLVAYRNIVWDSEASFLFYLEKSDIEAATEVFSRFFSSLRSSAYKYNVMEYKYYILHLLSAAKLDAGNDTPINIFLDITDDLRQQFRLIFDAESLYDCSINAFRNICQRNATCPIYPGNSVIEDMQTYIERNYSKNISLEFVSSLFYINRSYASTLFKSHFGISFIDCITQIRVEKAKELLKNTDLKLSQIAARVGYSNVKYFFRVFKKIVGTTPEQYRLH